MIIAIIQARIDSSRLPGKVLKKVLGKPLLEHLIFRLRGARTLNKIVIATTNNKSDNRIVNLARKMGVDFSRGSENDVLDRFYQTAKKFKADVIVRITGDCPLIDPVIVDEAVTFYKLNKRLDYVSNVNPPTYPDGMDVEIFSFKTLQQAQTEAKLSSEREHVTAYIRNNPNKFRIGNVVNKIDQSSIRLTLDEKEDFFVIKKIIEELYSKNEYFSLASIIHFIKKNKKLGLINSHIKRNEGYVQSLKQDKSD